MPTDVKHLPVQVKAADTPGRFTAVVSVFGNVDSYGDIVARGAFARTLEERGLPPVCWMHHMGIPPIGVAVSADETDEGLEVTADLFIDDDAAHDVARQVWTSLKRGAIREFSFGFRVIEAHMETIDGEDVRVLTDVDLFEVSPVWVGANPATRLVAVKATDTGGLNLEFTSDDAAADTGPAPQDTTPPAEPVDATQVAINDERAALLLAQPYQHQEVTT